MQATPTKRAMMRMTFDPTTAKVIPKPKGQWKFNLDGTIDVWMTESQYAEIMSFVDALLADFELETQLNQKIPQLLDAVSNPRINFVGLCEND